MNVDKHELITRGAEAEVWKGTWREREVIVKKRVKKGYRHPELDEKIRKMRIRKEGRLIIEARDAGVPVPIIYDIDMEDKRLIIEYFHGKRVMDCIEQNLDVNMEKIGEYVGKFHDIGISHGDLTTSNILYDEDSDRYCFIDFSLGDKDTSMQYLGVDLHLLREALISVHDNALELFDEIVEGHSETCSKHEKIMDWVKKIESRGRYQ